MSELFNIAQTLKEPVTFDALVQAAKQYALTPDEQKKMQAVPGFMPPMRSNIIPWGSDVAQAMNWLLAWYNRGFTRSPADLYANAQKLLRGEYEQVVPEQLPATLGDDVLRHIGFQRSVQKDGSVTFEPIPESAKVPVM